MKIYGNEKTNLTLTDKAFEVYSNTDPLKIIEEDDGTYSMTGCFERYGMSAEQVNSVLESFADECEDDDEDDEPVLQISKIAIKTETFCTPWNGDLYCVDICEDSEARSAWLYRSNCGVKTLMWGEDIKQTSRDDFLDMVFCNLPDYIDGYEEDIDKLEQM